MDFVKKLFLMIMVFGMLFISSCGDDDEGLDQTSLDLIGVWETADEVQFEVLITGLTPEELTEFQDFINLYLTGYAQGFFGTIEFKDDLSYTSSFGGETQTGTWQVLNEGENLVLSETGEVEDIELVIKSLTSSTLVLSFQETESEDLNGDGTDDEITIDIELTLNKVN